MKDVGKVSAAQSNTPASCLEPGRVKIVVGIEIGNTHILEVKIRAQNLLKFWERGKRKGQP